MFDEGDLELLVPPGERSFARGERRGEGIPVKSEEKRLV